MDILKVLENSYILKREKRVASCPKIIFLFSTKQVKKKLFKGIHKIVGKYFCFFFRYAKNIAGNMVGICLSCDRYDIFCYNKWENWISFATLTKNGSNRKDHRS